MNVKLDGQTIRQLCGKKGIALQELLREAGVSRTAYYSLLRRDSVLPGTVQALAGTLGVRPSTLLTEPEAGVWRAQALLRKARRILKRNPGLTFENIWHTLVLLEEKPVERLRRSLLRARVLDLH